MKKHKYMLGLILAGMVSLLSVSSLQARGFHPDYIDIDVVADDRGVLRQYDADWGRDEAERTYIEARDDERYSLRVRNNSGERIGIVIAVDGRNVISGKKSHLKPSERMYVLKPWQTAEFDGWRTARNRVNRFYFTGMDDSYSASWDDYSAMGVIAFAVFEERRPRRVVDEASSRGSTISKQSAAGRSAPGTGMGEDTWSPSRKVKFKPRKHALTKKFVRYEWRSTLCRQGIMSCRNHRDRGDWNRFWQEDDWGSRDGYAPRRR